MLTEHTKTPKVRALMKKMKTRKGLVHECNRVIREKEFSEEVKIKVSGIFLWEEDDTAYIEIDDNINTSSIELRISEVSKQFKQFQDRITAVLMRSKQFSDAAGEDEMEYWEKVLADAEKLPH